MIEEVGNNVVTPIKMSFHRGKRKLCSKKLRQGRLEVDSRLDRKKEPLTPSKNITPATVFFQHRLPHFHHGFPDDEVDSSGLDVVFHHYIMYDIYFTVNFVTTRPMEGKPKQTTAHKARYFVDIRCEEQDMGRNKASFTLDSSIISADTNNCPNEL